MKNELQYKLTHYAETPPEHIWADIEAALTDQTAPHASLLYNFEQVPPPEVWNRLENEFAAGEGKVISINKKNTHYGRYAAAAAVLVVLISAITFVVTRQKDSTEVAKTTPPVEKKSTNSNSIKEDEFNGQKNNTVVAITNQSGNSTSADQTKKEKAAAGRYLTIADDEGKKIRLSKKVAFVFDCADNIASVKGIRCKEDIESLQQKISASLVSTSGDFSGLIDMIKSLEENK